MFQRWSVRSPSLRARANGRPPTSLPHPNMVFEYPDIRRDDSVGDTFAPNNTRVPDPYRWLEDPDSEETRAFVDAENKVTDAYLADSAKPAIAKRLGEILDYPKTSVPKQIGAADSGRLMWRHNSGLQNQAVIMYRDGADGEPREWMDPNLIREDGTASVGTTRVSPCGKYVAYFLSLSGSDWQTIKVKEVDTGVEHDVDECKWVKFSGLDWRADSQGFFYSRYAADDAIHDAGAETTSAKNQYLCYHKLGTPQSEDVVVYRDEEHEEWMFGGDVTDDGKYLIITVSASCEPVNRVFYAPLAADGSVGDVVKVIDNFDAQYEYIANDDLTFYLQTNLNAPRQRLVRMDFADPANAVASAADVIAQRETDVLSWVLPVNENTFVACHMHDVKEVMTMYDWAGTETSVVPLPTFGTISGVSGRRKDREFYFSFVSFLYPGTAYAFDVAAGERRVVTETKVPNFDPENFVTEQVFFPSKDGTKVPMFIVGPKSAARNGDNPVLLYGYGGFNISLTPSFSASRVAFIEHFNGFLAIPNLRGGGEYGLDWYQAGIHERKQNVFDDFQAAAEYLIREKYTQPAKIAIHGGSNGGLLVGACVNQRPELYGAAVAAVGVMDMLRFHKFTIGHAWKSDYGCADEGDFETLIKYSPVHNVDAAKTYPAVLLTTADHDDRVCPLHSYKYIAALQHGPGRSPAQTEPLLIRIEVNAGHGAGKPLSKVIDEISAVYAFIGKALKVEWKA